MVGIRYNFAFCHWFIFSLFYPWHQSSDHVSNFFISKLTVSKTLIKANNSIHLILKVHSIFLFLFSLLLYFPVVFSLLTFFLGIFLISSILAFLCLILLFLPCFYVFSFLFVCFTLSLFLCVIVCLFHILSFLSYFLKSLFSVLYFFVSFSDICLSFFLSFLKDIWVVKKVSLNSWSFLSQPKLRIPEEWRKETFAFISFFLFLIKTVVGPGTVYSLVSTTPWRPIQ